MSRSTTHRYLITLEKLGAVERDDKDHFRLGLKVIELAGLVLSQNNLHNQSEAFLNELADRTHETIHLGVPIGTEVVYIDKVDSPRALRMFSYIGSRAAMYCTALGKAILAYAKPKLVDEVVQAGLVPRTPHTITTKHGLLEELKKVRARGYAVDCQENEMGVCCVGTPIFDYRAKVIGAISISGPAERMTPAQQREFGPLIRDAGLRLSKRMGYPH
jgi:IclR family acetate operon transcriptional repressor